MISPVAGPGPGSERGSGAIDLVLVAAFILIPVAFLMLSLPLLLEYRSMGDAAAREAVRACATAPDPSEGQRRAADLAGRILGERGLAPENAVVDIDCLAAWEPGGVVTAKVSLQAPAIQVMGVWRLTGVTIDRTYREQIEPHRSAP